MELDRTKQLLLVRAVEETDRGGEVIALDSRGLSESDGIGDEAVLARSVRLGENLLESHPREVHAAIAATAPAPWIKVAVVLLAFAIGVATKQLGPERRINVLAIPLLAILGWNLAVYVVSIAASLLRKDSGTAGVVGMSVKSLAARAMRRLESGTATTLGTGLSRFVREWHTLTFRARLAGVRCSFHLAAAALSAGVIVGMYWNGFAFQYLAAWESTFLSPDGVHGLFSALFAPASALSGIAIPPLEEIRSMELKSGDEGVPAANWIHLFAITVCLLVVLPRLALAARAGLQARRLIAQIDYREVAGDYIERLLKTREGGNLVARLIPHRMELGSKERDRLRAFVHGLWGGQLWVEFADPIGYGEEEEAVFEKADYQVLVLNYSATPEDESQGRLVRAFRDQLVGAGLVLLEATPFRERFGGLGEFERRMAERREAWDGILGNAGVRFVVLDDDLEESRGLAEDALLTPAE